MGSKKVDPITFIFENMKDVHYLYYNALVVRAVVAHNRLGKMVVDNRSSVNVIFWSTYEQMNIEIPLVPFPEPLYGFTGDCITPLQWVKSPWPSTPSWNSWWWT
ncbi:Beta-porphyranase [Abeliophyllum distichum]|uniref:Beta-porphyranase n=1 Tax=Abeliophyllum distichum TaxID=126358 RepID=A0ABD1SAG4_9LAMI